MLLQSAQLTHERASVGGRFQVTREASEGRGARGEIRAPNDLRSLQKSSPALQTMKRRVELHRRSDCTNTSLSSARHISVFNEPFHCVCLYCDDEPDQSELQTPEF